jgi:hypothetical protein
MTGTRSAQKTQITGKRRPPNTRPSRSTCSTALASLATEAKAMSAGNPHCPVMPGKPPRASKAGRRAVPGRSRRPSCGKATPALAKAWPPRGEAAQMDPSHWKSRGSQRTGPSLATGFATKLPPAVTGLGPTGAACPLQTETLARAPQHHFQDLHHLQDLYNNLHHLHHDIHHLHHYVQDHLQHQHVNHQQSRRQLKTMTTILLNSKLVKRPSSGTAESPVQAIRHWRLLPVDLGLPGTTVSAKCFRILHVCMR